MRNFIKSLHLENFKSFGDRVVIPMSPITLILGENSAGKFSILQALNLLKQSLNTDGLRLNPRFKDGIVDLGSTSELLFDHDADRKLKFRIMFGDSDSSTDDSGLELHFDCSIKNRDTRLCQLEIIDSYEDKIACFQAPSNLSDPEIEKEINYKKSSGDLLGFYPPPPYQFLLF